MKYIDIENWKRKEHYQFFGQMDYPQYNICMNLDVSNFVRLTRENHLSFYYSMIFASTLVMNQMDEFKYRIRDGKVVMHDTLHPSFTDMQEGDELFKFLLVEMEDSLANFVNKSTAKNQAQTAYFPLEELAGRDDLVYITCLPWVSFTHLSHTISLNREDAVPRVSWGKYFKDNGRVLLPFSVQVNHAFVDGLHVGKYVEKLQNYLDTIE